MPGQGWHRRSRDPALVERDLERYRRRHPHLFPELERTPDLSRGEIRFASEAMLALVAGKHLPDTVVGRAMNIAVIMAKG